AMNAKSRWQLSRRAVLLASGAVAIAACTPALTFAQEDVADPGVLTARLQDLRSIREIKRLQHTWGHHAEAGRWGDMAALFAAGGSWTDGSRTVEGPATLRDFLRASMGSGNEPLASGQLNLRLFLTPVITLADDGRSARGRWHEVAMTGEMGK